MQNDLYQFILSETVYTDIYWYLCEFVAYTHVRARTHKINNYSNYD